MNKSYIETSEQQKQKKQLRNLPFKQWWFLYVGVAVIALLTLFAGAYLGMSPNANGMILFKDNWDAAGKILFSIFYMVMFFITAEAAFLFWLDKLILHDVDDKQESVRTQLWSAWGMLALSLLTMIITSIAASQILAAWRHSFGGSAIFPAWTQGWILEAIPFLVIVHIICATLYKSSTKEAQLERWRKSQIRSARTHALDAGTQAYVNEFNRTAPQAATSAYTRRAQEDVKLLRSELEIYEEEKRTGVDINKDGFIGTPQNNNHKQPMNANVSDTEFPTVRPPQK